MAAETGINKGSFQTKPTGVLGGSAGCHLKAAEDSVKASNIQSSHEMRKCTGLRPSHLRSYLSACDSKLSIYSSHENGVAVPTTRHAPVMLSHAMRKMKRDLNVLRSVNGNRSHNKLALNFHARLTKQDDFNRPSYWHRLYSIVSYSVMKIARGQGLKVANIMAVYAKSIFHLLPNDFPSKRVLLPHKIDIQFCHLKTISAQEHININLITVDMINLIVYCVYWRQMNANDVAHVNGLNCYANATLA
eukprot:2569551-Pleurochrysis_carterae.AAC.1